MERSMKFIKVLNAETPDEHIDPLYINVDHIIHIGSGTITSSKIIFSKNSCGVQVPEQIEETKPCVLITLSNGQIVRARGELDRILQMLGI